MCYRFGGWTSQSSCTNSPLLTIPESIRSGQAYPDLPSSLTHPVSPPRVSLGPDDPAHQERSVGTQTPIMKQCLGALGSSVNPRRCTRPLPLPTPVMLKAISQVNWRENLVTIAFTVDSGKHSAVKSLFLFLLQILIYLALCQAVC